MMLDTANPNSIYSCLRAARQNARSVRETISSEMWEQINTHVFPYAGSTDLAGGRWTGRACCASIRMGCHLFHGITDATMTHNEAWHFLRLGGSIERADKISRILDVKYFMLLPSATFVGTPYDDLHWAAILKSVSGFEMYRKKYGRITAPRHRRIPGTGPRLSASCPILCAPRRRVVTRHNRNTDRAFSRSLRAGAGNAARQARLHFRGQGDRRWTATSFWTECRSISMPSATICWRSSSPGIGQERRP